MATFLIGFYLGGKGKAMSEEVREKLTEIIKERPRPVVNKLTPEQLEEKKSPTKRGNLEAFNQMFREWGIKKPVIKKEE
jgi:hypothetical protein